MNLVAVLPYHHHVEVDHWNSFKPGTFREQFRVRLPDGNSFWMGAALNGTSVAWGRCRVDFNPNKVANSDALQALLGFFKDNTHRIQRKATRFDLAIDIPVQRQNCFLIKDRRLFIERRHGQELTQYLGSKSSTVGRVKLYNKSIESNLDYPLTRLELTLDPSVPHEKINWPKVFYVDADEICIGEGRITDTELFILNALLQGYGSLTDLGRKTRAKIEMLMQTYLKTVEVSAESYAVIQTQLQTYISENSL